MAAIKKKSGLRKSGSQALLALSSAALALPGMQAAADIPVAEPQLNTQFGYYSEEGDRMTVQVYHGGFVAPVNDWLQLSFAVDQDTYVGASPSYVVPASSADIVTKASGFENAGGPVFGLMNDEIQANAFADPTILAGIFSDIGSGFVLPLLPADVAQKVNKDPNDFGVRLQTEMIKRYLEKQQSGSDRTPTQIIEPHPLETRHMPVMGGKLFLGPYTLSASGGYSLEPDYESTFASTYHSFEFNDKLTTLTLGYRLANNKIIREAPATGGPHDHGGQQADFEATNTFRTYSLGLSQILSKNTLLYLNGEYTRRRGYLSNPYKLVHIKGLLSAADYTLVGFYAPLDDTNRGWNYYTGVELSPMGIDLYRENRPDKRDQWSVGAGINQYFSDLDGALHANYRYQWDDWELRSHTLDLAWYQNLPFGVMLKPQIRYYSQTAAEFYAPYFLAPRADGHYSSDYRLSAFGKFSGGLTVSKQFAKGFTVTGGFEYFVQKSSLGLDGDDSASFADIDSYLLTAALDVNLSRLGRGLTDRHLAHNHRHGGHPPAGIMYGHMLDKAGDFMISYTYGHAERAETFQHGTRTGIGDQELVAAACPGGVCEFKAASMRMDMHMVNFMYAPTEWLNLMVMPQFAYMKMDMDPLPSTTVTEGGYHENVGLGDTVMSALVELFENDSHEVHLGIGVSAPTGRVDVTFDGFINDSSQLQSYGMQLGSGTWDLKPSLTYNGHAGRWFWGAQLSGTKRLQSRNSQGYALGDEFSGSLWSGFRVSDWLSFSLRNQYTNIGSVRGRAPRMFHQVDPDDNTDTPQLTTNLSEGNYGGKFWDIGLGVTFSVPGGDLAGHALSVEWLQPVVHDVNGYQLERDGTLLVRWGYAF